MMTPGMVYEDTETRLKIKKSFVKAVTCIDDESFLTHAGYLHLTQRVEKVRLGKKYNNKAIQLSLPYTVAGYSTGR